MKEKFKKRTEQNRTNGDRMKNPRVKPLRIGRISDVPSKVSRAKISQQVMGRERETDYT